MKNHILLVVATFPIIFKLEAMLPYRDEDDLKSLFKFCGAWLLVKLAVIWLFILLKSVFTWLLLLFELGFTRTVSSVLCTIVLNVAELILSSLSFLTFYFYNKENKTHSLILKKLIPSRLDFTFTNNRLDSLVFSSSLGTLSWELLVIGSWPSSLSESDGPPGNTLRLHTGQKRLLRSNHLSMHSTWYAVILLWTK